MLYLIKTDKRTVKAFSVYADAVTWIENKIKKSNKLVYRIVEFDY